MAKRITLLFTLTLFWIISEAFADQDYINTDLTPTENLVRLFRELTPMLKDCKSIPESTLKSILDPRTPASNISIYDLYKIANEKFKKPKSVERSNIALYNEKFLTYDSPRVRQLLKEIGDKETIYPNNPNPKFILIIGGTINKMRKRVNFLARLVEEKKINITSATEIVFLISDRDLNTVEKSREVQFHDNKYNFSINWKAPQKLAQTEYELAKIIWSQISMPAQLRMAKIKFISASRKKAIDHKDSKLVIYRPTTIDTLAKWLNENKAKSGHCLCVVNQPFVKYYEYVIKRGFLQENRKELTAEAIGPAKFNNDYMLAIYFDNIARSLYEITVTENLNQLRSIKK
jgi:hypothetical protein